MRDEVFATISLDGRLVRVDTTKIDPDKLRVMFNARLPLSEEQEALIGLSMKLGYVQFVVKGRYAH